MLGGKGVLTEFQDDPPVELLDSFLESLRDFGDLGISCSRLETLQRIQSDLLGIGPRRLSANGRKLNWIAGYKALANQLVNRKRAGAIDLKDLRSQLLACCRNKMPKRAYNTVFDRERGEIRTEILAMGGIYTGPTSCVVRLSEDWISFCEMVHSLPKEIERVLRKAIVTARIIVTVDQSSGVRLIDPKVAAETKRADLDRSGTEFLFSGDLQAWFTTSELNDTQTAEAEATAWLSDLIDQAKQAEKKLTKSWVKKKLKSKYGISRRPASTLLNSVWPISWPSTGNIPDEERFIPRKSKS